ncbi:MAG: Lrp/AsnC family transcriptional regulator [Luminiphilus sp.]|nr:Lrp/AsnC family transcriptional regulator [Luminiphilus sp.]MDG2036596.1 Lrp/AsnC family transcriptional regulator [Luminiphilus sp.]|tara:strand:- start:1567 stop:2040 length:474 start_codon:yes stop_codon:yes gene_type:complete
MKMQKSDIKILAALQHDADISTSDLAAKVNLSQSPCWRRVNKFEESGLIRRRVALLDRQKLGLEVVVFATVNLNQIGKQNLLAFERTVESYPEVVECYTMAGIWDYMLKIVCRDIRHYEDFVRNTLSASDAIRELHSHIAVTEIKNTTELPLVAESE